VVLLAVINKEHPRILA